MFFRRRSPRPVTPVQLEIAALKERMEATKVLISQARQHGVSEFELEMAEARLDLQRNALARMESIAETINA